LLTDKAEKKEFIYKKPHPLVQRYWNDRASQLGSFILEQKENIKNNMPEALLHLRNNLFVAPEFSELVEANLRESADSLDSLALQIEKVKHLYDSIR
jgi:MoxR-like ATPase